MKNERLGSVTQRAQGALQSGIRAPRSPPSGVIENEENGQMESKNLILLVSSQEHRFGRCLHHHDARLYPSSPKPRSFGRGTCSKGRREENWQLDDDFSVE